MNSTVSRPEITALKKRTWLKLLRVQRELTQAETAKSCGISQMIYSCIESGRMVPTEEEAKTIGAFFGFDWMKFYK